VGADRRISLDRIFPGDSEMARRMRAFDWEASPLGSPDAWPSELTGPLSMMLTSRFEMWLGWGPGLSFFYNDAYIPTLGEKHPRALGQPFQTVWREVYADVEPQVAAVMCEGRATWNKALLLLLERNGYPEETYHTFSYSPLREGDDVRGMMCIVTEETERVISERRFETVRRLSECLIGAMSQEAVLEGLCEGLARNTEDFPFALVFVEGPAGDLIGHSATAKAGGLIEHPWPLKGEARICEHPLDLALTYPMGGWSLPPSRALIVPVPGSQGARAATLVLGLNPHRRGDAGLLDLAQMIADRAAGAFAQAKAVEAERRRSDRIWTHARDLMVVVDGEGVFRSVSPAWTRVLGHDASDVIGRRMEDFVEPEDAALTRVALAQCTAGQDVTGFENRYRTRQGGWRWISWNTASEDGLMYGYGRDITAEKLQAQQLRHAEEALRQAQKMEAIGQLTGGVAHDFNNLLTVIRSSADLLRKEDLPAARRRRYIDAIAETADRAAKLTSQLLAFSRRQALTAESFDVRKKVAALGEMLRSVLGARIALEVDIAGEPCVVEADASQFETALINLAVNARDAMDGEGRLMVRIFPARRPDLVSAELSAEDNFVAVAVTDHGTGISPASLSRIFEPFFTTKEVGRGTGLGLSQVYGFAKQSGGDITVDSSEGRGATFTLYMPRSVKTVAEIPLGPAASEHRHEGRILVVEDNPKIGEFATQLLRDLGYGAEWVADADSALTRLEGDEGFNLVFSDVVMPGVGGVELARLIRRRWPMIRVVLTSGYSDALAADAHHGFLLLRKPYSIEELSRTLSDGFASSMPEPDSTISHRASDQVR
jgi:PAS domain S-box-containing protein